MPGVAHSHAHTTTITTYKPKVTPPLARYNDSSERRMARYTHRGCQKSASVMLPPPHTQLSPRFPVASSFSCVSPARAHSHRDGARTLSVLQKFDKSSVKLVTLVRRYLVLNVMHTLTLLILSYCFCTTYHSFMDLLRKKEMYLLQFVL